MLQVHIEKWHLREYIQIVSDPNRQWAIKLATVNTALNLGYTYDELKDLVEKNGNISGLPPRSNVTPPDDGASRTRASVPFSLPSLHRHLVDFIVADDQSLNVVECVEFRRLLLFLREDLKDTDIPHRTKIKSDIIEAISKPTLVCPELDCPGQSPRSSRLP